jgi:hypothetical protein
MSQTEMLDAAYREYNLDEVQGGILKILEPGNEFLQELVDKFGKTRSLPNKAQVACFFELKSSNVGAIVGGEPRTVIQPKISLGLYRKLSCHRDSSSAKALAV